MKLNIRKFCLLLFCSSFFLFFSCASKPSFEGKGDLCGIIIDENNKPVKDFIVYCKPVNQKFLSQALGPVKTNESGLFVVYGLSAGQYLLSGNKKNYLSLEPHQYSFEDRTRIICLQTRSYKSALERAGELAAMGQKKDAEDLLSKISYEKNSREELYIKAYQFLLSDDKDERLSILTDLKNNEYQNDSFFMDYTKKLEEMMK